MAGLVALAVGAFAAVAGPSAADVTSVVGSAVGASGTFSIFGGTQFPLAPTPSVTLAPDASNSPQDASAASASLVAPPPPAQPIAVILQTGALTVHTEGTTGAGGSVTSTASVDNVGPADAAGLRADNVSSTCTASETGVTGSTTITSGVVQTSDEPLVTEPAPGTPAPNTTIHGVLSAVGDTYDVVLNEQVTNANGSLTVTGYHLKALGPTGVGDVFVAQVTCGVSAAAGPTTTTPGVTTTTPGVTTTTPGVTTTTPGVTTTTPRATTTVAGVTTTTPATPTVPTSTPPTPGVPTQTALARTGSSSVRPMTVLSVFSLAMGLLLLVGFNRRPAWAGNRATSWAGRATWLRSAAERLGARRPPRDRGGMP